MPMDKLDDSWRAKAQQRVKPMTVANLIERLRRENPEAVAAVDVLADYAVHPLGDGLCAATGVSALDDGTVLIRIGEGD